jgi:hypothetical protein
MNKRLVVWNACFYSVTFPLMTLCLIGAKAHVKWETEKAICSTIALAPSFQEQKSFNHTHTHTQVLALGCIRFADTKSRVQMSEYCIDCVFFSNTLLSTVHAPYQFNLFTKRHVASDEKTSPRHHLEGTEHVTREAWFALIDQRQRKSLDIL